MAVPAILSELIVQAFNGFDTGDDDDWDAYDAAKLLISPVVKMLWLWFPTGGSWLTPVRHSYRELETTKKA